MLAGKEYLGEVVPLIKAGIAPCRVIGGGLDEHDRARWEILDRAFQAVPVKALLGGIVVWKIDKLDSKCLENVSVID